MEARAARRPTASPPTVSPKAPEIGFREHRHADVRRDPTGLEVGPCAVRYTSLGSPNLQPLGSESSSTSE
jgi:hypothetical protein